MKNIFFFVSLFIFVFGSITDSNAQQENNIEIVVIEDQSIRDIALYYLDDADLWNVLLKENQLNSALDIKPGMKLTIPRGWVLNSKSKIREAMESIRMATDAGSRVFASKIIEESIKEYNQSLKNYSSGSWKLCLQNAETSIALAERALRTSLEERNAKANATVSYRKGTVENRRPNEPVWADAPLYSKLFEYDRVRTLSKSLAEILFHDQNRLKLNENSQAVIQRARVDLLENRKESIVTLEKGDAYAMLIGDQSRKKFDINMPGLSTKINSTYFWLNKDPADTKIANYNGEIEVASRGVAVTIKENQGSLVPNGGVPSPPADLLPSPNLLFPAKNDFNYTGEVEFSWSQVEGAESYWFVIAKEKNFDEIMRLEKQLTRNSYNYDDLIPNVYYWRVAAIDKKGFPGPYSAISNFTVRKDDKSPYLVINSPAQNITTSSREIIIEGKTERDAGITVNGMNIDVDEINGTFRNVYLLNEPTNIIEITAVDKAGNKTLIQREIKYEPSIDLQLVYDSLKIKKYENHYVIYGPSLNISGITNPSAEVKLEVLPGGEQYRTFADKSGNFDLDVIKSGMEEVVHITVNSAGGLQKNDTIYLRPYQPPPIIRLETEPSYLSVEENVSLSGTVENCDWLLLNDRKIKIEANKFDEVVSLLPGLNVFELSAFNRFGFEDSKKVYLYADETPPLLLDYKLKVHSSYGKTGVSIIVKASDETQLKKTCLIILRCNDKEIPLYLKWNVMNEMYEGSMFLTSCENKKIILKTVTLSDYLGNIKEYLIE